MNEKRHRQNTNQTQVQGAQCSSFLKNLHSFSLFLLFIFTLKIWCSSKGGVLQVTASSSLGNIGC